MLITDTVMLGDTRVTRDGYLVADVKIARTGIQHYSGAEMGRPDLSTVRVYRPDTEVFHADALASMAHRPVTLDHPSEAVTATNWKKLSVGMTGGEVARDGDFIRVPMTLQDQGAIDAVKAGKRQLSVGYRAEIDWTAGTAPDGQTYDAVQRKIVGNHLAIVDQARAGPACRIGDGWSAQQDGGQSMAGENLVAVMVDGLTIQTTDQGKQAIEKVSKQLADANTAKATADAALATAQTLVSTRDGEIVALKQQLKDAEITPAKLDAAVATRAKVVADARKIAGDKLGVDGKTDVEIRRAAVAGKIGDEAAKAMDDAAIGGAFTVLSAAGVATAGADPLRKVLGDGATPTADASATAYSKSVEDLNAWRTKTA